MPTASHLPSDRSARLADLLGVDHPIVQGPFGGGLSRAGLTAAVADKGGLGSFGAEALTPGEIEQTARDIRARTDKPFNLNLWVSRADAGGSRPEPRDLEQLLDAVERPRLAAGALAIKC